MNSIQRVVAGPHPVGTDAERLRRKSIPATKLPNSTSTLPVAAGLADGMARGNRSASIGTSAQSTSTSNNFFKDIKFKMKRCAEPLPLRKHRTISIVSPAPPGISHFFEGQSGTTLPFRNCSDDRPPSPLPPRVAGQSEAQSAIMSVAPHFCSQSRKHPAAEPSCIGPRFLSDRPHTHTHRSCR